MMKEHLAKIEQALDELLDRIIHGHGDGSTAHMYATLSAERRELITELASADQKETP